MTSPRYTISNSSGESYIYNVDFVSFSNKFPVLRTLSGTLTFSKNILCIRSFEFERKFPVLRPLILHENFQ